MYEDEYEKKGYPIRNFVLKVILIILVVGLLVWLVPKYNQKNVQTKQCSTGTCDTSGIEAVTSQIFSDNLDKMKQAAISYYTDERLPKEVGESDTMTLSDMIGKKLIVALIDKNNKACDVEASYVKITKLDDEYLLKVNLKDSEKEDYILVHLGCYTYCDSYICEKQSTNTTTYNSSKNSNVSSIVPIKGTIKDGTYYYPSTKPSNTSCKGSHCETIKPTKNPTTKPTNKPTDRPCRGKECDEPTPTPSDSPKPTYKPEYIYEYKKTTSSRFSYWTSWSNWEKTNCSTKEINCSDSNPSCLYKLQMTSRKEQIGTYRKTYAKKRSQIVQTGSYQVKSCNKYNFVKINNTLYATTTSTTYTTINTITRTTRSSVGSWQYAGRASYSNPPRDTAGVSYKFVGADYSYCSDTCTTLPNYYYDKYTYTGGLTSTSSTTVPITTSSSSSSTSSSTQTSYEASCGGYSIKTVPIYGTVNATEKSTRTEKLYGMVCYQSTKSRKLISKGSTSIKWSKYNDKSLLNNGWTYTGRKKQK